MKSLAALLLTFLLWPWPPVPDEVVLPFDPPSKPVGLFRSEATFQALGWRSRWEWRGAQATLKKLDVDFEVVEPEDLEDWDGQVLVLPNVRNMSRQTVATIKAKNVRVLATYMSSYRADDNSSWTPNNFALSSVFGADFKSWVGSGAQADHLQLSKALGGQEVPLGRHLAMLVKPHPGSKILASWGDSEASIVEGPGGIFVGEDLFAPENSDSQQVQQLIANLLNRLAPGLAANPVEAGKSEWPEPPLADLPKMGQTVRVGLEPLTGAVSFRARGGLVVDGKKAGTTLSWTGKPTTIVGKPFLELLHKRSNGSYQWAAYRGTLEVGEGGALINALDFEDYLAGVVPSEVPAYFPTEALKTMAVVARTYGLSHLKRHDGYDVCSQVHCQVYRGLASEAESTNLAVRATTGQQLLFDGKPADTTFHAACGGVGVDVWRTWPSAPKLPYLKGRLDQPKAAELNLADEATLRRFLDAPPASYCAKSGRFRWKERTTRAELRDKLAKGLEGSLGKEFHGLPELVSIKVTARAPQGRVETLEIRSAKDVYTVHGDAIRWLWSGGKIGTGGLQSTLFYLLEEKDQITVVGGGWGHGVGLCQQGAAGRAEAGYLYPDIIKHYYPGTALTVAGKGPVAPASKGPAAPSSKAPAAPASKPGAGKPAGPVGPGSVSPTGKPGSVPAAKPATPAAGKPVSAPAAKPATPAAGKPVSAPAGKPATPAAGKPVSAPAAKPASAPPAKSSEPVAKPVAKPVAPSPAAKPVTPAAQPVSAPPVRVAPEAAPTPPPLPAPQSPPVAPQPLSPAPPSAPRTPATVPLPG